MKTIGEVLKEQREFLGMSAAQVADYAMVGVQTVYDIENGRTNNPSFAVVVHICDALEMTTDDLVDWMED